MSTYNAMAAKRHKLLSELEDYVAETGIDFGLSVEHADQLGIGVANFLAEHFGGQNLTFPKDCIYKMSLRDLQIYDEYNGGSLVPLCEKYGITERGLRKVLHRVHKRIMSERQPSLDLFNDEGN